MGKKRKLNSKSPSAAIRQEKLKQQQEEEQRQQQHVEEEPMEEEDEAEEDEEDPQFEVVEGEEEEEEEDEDEDDDDDGEEEAEHKNTMAASVSSNVNADDDDEPIQKLLEPFSKDKLITILREAAESHYDVAARIRQIADEDPVHRKIFVHGLGWDTTTDTLRNSFGHYGEIDDCKAVVDKVSGKSKGYGFILFKTRSGAIKALKQPQKKIGNRMTSCQLSAIGPVPYSAGAAASAAQQQPVSEFTQRKIYVSNVSSDLDPQKLTYFFAKYGEIEEGPLGLDRQTGKPKGFCLFVYKSVESARKALEEPHKNFEGHILHCQKAIDGQKPGKQHQNQQRKPHIGRNENPSLAGAIGGPPATGAGQLIGQSVAGIPFNQGAAAQALNPAIGQALTALLASQGAGLGLTNLLGTLGTAGLGPAVNPAGAGQGLPSGYVNQGVASSGVLGGYGGQAGLQGTYPNQQVGGSGRSQHGVGHMGGVAPYTGH